MLKWNRMPRCRCPGVDPFPSFPYPFQNRIKLLTWSDKHWLRYLVQKLRNRVVFFFFLPWQTTAPQISLRYVFMLQFFPILKGCVLAEFMLTFLPVSLSSWYVWDTEKKRDALRSLPWCQTFFACDPALQIRFGNRFDLYIKLFVPFNCKYQTTDIKPQEKTWKWKRITVEGNGVVVTLLSPFYLIVSYLIEAVWDERHSSLTRVPQWLWTWLNEGLPKLPCIFA